MKRRSELDYEIKEKLKLQMLKSRMGTQIANSSKNSALLGHAGHRSQSEKKKFKKKASPRDVSQTKMLSQKLQEQNQE